MTEAIRIHQTGGPEVMSWEEVRLTAPGPGEALVRHHYVGVNFIDIYQIVCSRAVFWSCSGSPRAWFHLSTLAPSA
jgi:NADPH:quinone reductase-like Zn-dependent oxidoreductase